MSARYPMFVKLTGRRCVVVGGGRVAQRKVRGLIESGASVVVIAPNVTEVLTAAGDRGDLTICRRGYEVGDLEGAFLVFAATNDSAVNGAVISDAAAVGALVNAAEDPTSGDFFVPATVRRDDLVLAISTGGRSPTFARHVRAELEAWLTPSRIDLLDLLADVRGELQAAGCNPAPDAWRRAVSEPVLGALASGDRISARASLLHDLMAPTSAVTA